MTDEKTKPSHTVSADSAHAFTDQNRGTVEFYLNELKHIARRILRQWQRGKLERMPDDVMHRVVATLSTKDAKFVDEEVQEQIAAMIGDAFNANAELANTPYSVEPIEPDEKGRPRFALLIDADAHEQIEALYAKAEDEDNLPGDPEHPIAEDELHRRLKQFRDEIPNATSRLDSLIRKRVAYLCLPDFQVTPEDRDRANYWSAVEMLIQHIKNGVLDEHPANQANYKHPIIHLDHERWAFDEEQTEEIIARYNELMAEVMDEHPDECTCMIGDTFEANQLTDDEVTIEQPVGYHLTLSFPNAQSPHEVIDELDNHEHQIKTRLREHIAGEDICRSTAVN